MMNRVLDNVLRRLSVRTRIVGGFMLILSVAGVVATIILLNLNSLVARTERFTTVDATIERLFLLASRRVITSQLNLNRYNQGLVPSPYQARDDVVLALISLKEAKVLAADSDITEEIDLIIASLEDYQQGIDKLQAAHTTGSATEITRLEAELAKLGNDISFRLELMANNNAKQVEIKTAEVLSEADRYSRTGLLFLGFGFLFAVLLSALISFSVTQPLTDFRIATAAFKQQNQLPHISEGGHDEFTEFARLFNNLGEQMAGLVSNLERRVEERTIALSRRTAQHQAASQVARQAAAIKDPSSLVNDAVQLITEKFGFYHAGFFLLDEHKQYAVLLAASSEGGKKMIERGHRLQVGSQGIVGYAAAQKRPRIALDTGADAAYFTNPELPNTHSEVAVPLIAREQVIGVLDIQSENTNAFSQEDFEILQTLADQLALAFENARLLNEMEASLMQMEQLSAQNVRHSWSEEGAPGLAAAIQYTPLGIQNIPRKQTGASDGRSALSVPILLHNQKIGAINLKRKQENNVWSKRDREMLNEIAIQIGLALENARLLSEAQRRAAHERMIGEVTSRIGAAFDVETVLRTTAQEIGKALGDTEVSIHLQKDGKG